MAGLHFNGDPSKRDTTRKGRYIGIAALVLATSAACSSTGSGESGGQSYTLHVDLSHGNPVTTAIKHGYCGLDFDVDANVHTKAHAQQLLEMQAFNHVYSSYETNPGLSCPDGFKIDQDQLPVGTKTGDVVGNSLAMVDYTVPEQPKSQ